MKNIISGIGYNFRGFKLGITTACLLILGIVRFVVMVVVTIAAAVMILANYQEILALMWTRPESFYIVWLWHLVSWLLALVLTAVSALLAYLLAQIFFSAVIMDKMSQITERKITGDLKTPDMPMWSFIFYLIRQEIPRAVLPVVISLLILILGWFTPLGPVLTIVSPLVAGIFPGLGQYRPGAGQTLNGFRPTRAAPAPQPGLSSGLRPAPADSGAEYCSAVLCAGGGYTVLSGAD